MIEIQRGKERTFGFMRVKVHLTSLCVYGPSVQYTVERQRERNICDTDKCVLPRMKQISVCYQE